MNIIESIECNATEQRRCVAMMVVMSYLLSISGTRNKGSKNTYKVNKVKNINDVRYHSTNLSLTLLSTYYNFETHLLL